jgi:endogenous inhibitor of DNA gyrase (YacG/DUF329 family)
MNAKLTFTTSAFPGKCPDCGAEIEMVQFGGPRVGHDDYPGFQFVRYACRADYFFDDRKEILSVDRVLCPSTLKDCKLCGRKVGGLVCSKNQEELLQPFCSDQCAIDWARANAK